MAELVQTLESADARQLNPAVFEAIADRLEAALASSDNDTLKSIAGHLEDVARRWMAAGSDASRKSARGDADAERDLVFMFMAGRLAFAQNLAARALDKRASDEFYEQIVDGKYEQYVRALLSGPKSGKDLSDLIGEAEETVSRKLKVLEETGIIQRRRKGQVTINVLSPSARVLLEHRRVGPLGGLKPEMGLAAHETLIERADQIPVFLKAPPMLGAAQAGAAIPLRRAAGA